MPQKTILLYEKYSGVLFVLEKSLSIYQDEITVHASSDKKGIKRRIAQDNIDLLITELSQADLNGMEISSYARQNGPDIKIIWITASNCSVFRRQSQQYQITKCIEKPLDIKEFREDVLEVLGI